jgi:hypothetical protein
VLTEGQAIGGEAGRVGAGQDIFKA